MDELCLVGGCAAGLLISDPGASPVRPTEDVDLVVEAVQYTAYHNFCGRLPKRGFSQHPESDDPICRWRRDGLVVDIMPLDETILGFSNRWYIPAFDTRQVLTLPRGSIIRHIDAPHFLATKLTAFEGRGEGDYAMSHDLEDLVRVVDGRPEIVDEVAAGNRELRVHVASGIRAFRGGSPVRRGLSRVLRRRARTCSHRRQTPRIPMLAGVVEPLAQERERT